MKQLDGGFKYECLDFEHWVLYGVSHNGTIYLTETFHSEADLLDYWADLMDGPY